jgi:sensor histidine kinase regulating citrate/malate metabolism
MLLLITVNLYFFTRKQFHRSSLQFHVSSFFLCAALFCDLIQTVILGLPFALYYILVRNISLILFLITLLLFFIAHLNEKRSDLKSFLSAPDLKSAFLAIDDIAVIIDYKGIIRETNHSPLFHQLFLNANTFLEMMAHLKKQLDPALPYSFVHTPLNKKAPLQEEIHLVSFDTDYLLMLTPIIRRNNYLGHIVLLHDITSIKKVERQLKAQNLELQSANEHLRNQIHVSTKLETEKERLKLIETFQKSFIDKIEENLSLIKPLQERLQTNPQDAKKTS